MPSGGGHDSRYIQNLHRPVTPPAAGSFTALIKSSVNLISLARSSLARRQLIVSRPWKRQFATFFDNTWLGRLMPHCVRLIFDTFRRAVRPFPFFALRPCAAANVETQSLIWNSIVRLRPSALAKGAGPQSPASK